MLYSIFIINNYCSGLSISGGKKIAQVGSYAQQKAARQTCMYFQQNLSQGIITRSRAGKKMNQQKHTPSCGSQN